MAPDPRQGPDPRPGPTLGRGAGLAFRPPTVDRSFERRIVVVGILLTALYLVAALASTGLAPADRRGVWLPLHLALAGGASTAIAAVMPFFVAAFAAVPPADGRLRSAAVALVSVGALLVVVGMTGDTAILAAAGGVAYVVGIALTGLAVVRPVGGSLGPSRGLVTRAYVVALVNVGVGVSLATLLLAGWAPVAGAWLTAKPTHAWLNAIGFVSLVVATTLLHFFPTVVGARISAKRSARGVVVGIGAGAPLAAAGTLVGIGWLAAVGALAVLVGAISLAAMARHTWRTRGGWTTDLPWHRFAQGGLASGIGWFIVAAAIMAWRTVDAALSGAGLVGGQAAAPTAAAQLASAWSTSWVAAPLVAGWLGITFLASATHLLPAVGPGSPIAHARQRRILGWGTAPRLLALDAGCLLLALGLPLGLDGLARLGAALLAVGAGATTLLLVAAVAAGAPGGTAAGGQPARR